MKYLCKNFLLIILTLSLILTGSSVSFAENETDSDYHQLGLIVDENELANLNEHIIESAQTYAVLPSAVDNTSKFPTPGNQGSQKSCTAWAVGYALKSQQEAAKRNWTVNTNEHNFSPAYIYNSLCGGANVGLSVGAVVTFLENYGVCPLSYFPYDDSDYLTQPTAIQNAAASLYKTVDYGIVIGLSAIKSQIFAGEGVVLGIALYPDFDNISNSNQVYDNTNGTSRGEHAICLIGYDDNKGDSGAFKFINSWGTDTQLNGYGWISYDLVLNEAVNQYGEGVGVVINVSETDDYVMGDVDGDGTVTAADSRIILRYSADLEAPTAMQFVLADANGDASITAADAQAVLQYSSGLIAKLPLYE